MAGEFEISSAGLLWFGPSCHWASLGCLSLEDEDVDVSLARPCRYCIYCIRVKRRIGKSREDKLQRCILKFLEMHPEAF
jgi:hypothetical protein